MRGQDRGTKYDPWEHALRLGVTVVTRELSNVDGMWVPDASTIVLDERLSSFRARNVLAHELGHAYHGHLDGRHSNDLEADRFARWHLIDDDELEDAQAVSSWPEVWSHRLGVGEHLLRLHMLEDSIGARRAA